jgi:predicted nucleic acid-binding protein
MKLVLDASVAFKWIVREAHTDDAIQIRSGILVGTVEAVAPDIYPIELVHAITRAERQKRLTPAEGAAAMADSLIVRPLLVHYLPLLPRAYEISSSMRIGVYDCLYVALAEREQCELVTADAKLVKNLRHQFPFLKPLSSLP